MLPSMNHTFGHSQELKPLSFKWTETNAVCCVTILWIPDPLPLSPLQRSRFPSQVTKSVPTFLIVDWSDVM